MSYNDIETKETETLEDKDGQIDQDALFNEAFEAIRKGEALPKEEQPAPVEEDKPEPEDSTDPPPEQDATPPQEQDDWISKIPEDLRDKVGGLLTERESLLNNYKALHNRLAPTQRQLADAQRRLKEREQLDLDSTTPTAQKNDSSEKQALPSDKDELWDKITESDPVLAEAFEKRLAASLQREREALRKEFQDSIAPLQEKSTSQEFNQELDTLLSVIPNAPEVLQSPEFSGWLEAQSPTLQALHASPKAQDCIQLLQLYSLNAQHVYQQSQQPNDPAVEGSTQDTTEADRIAAQRKDRLANPVPTTGTRPTAPKAKPLDTDESLDKFFNDTLKEQLKLTSAFHRGR